MPLIRLLRARIYDAAIVGMTERWYRAVLQRLPQRARVLDVGIGTGSALFANADLLVERDLCFVGIDVDAAYVERCRDEMLRRQLSGRVEVHLESIDDHHGRAYDAVYFSGSFMLLPNPAAALRHACTLLAPNGRLYFTQTFEHRRAPALEVMKPLLRLLTTIDFGRVTYEDEFRQTLAAAAVELEEIVTLDNQARRASVMVRARPASTL